MLTLAHLEGFSDEELRTHLKDEYTAKAEVLELWDIVIAYEHVGSFGCDSASYWLLKARDGSGYAEVSGSHCSCYGFEDQFDLELCTLEELKAVVGSNQFAFYAGGYDDDSDEHRAMIVAHIVALR